MSWTTIPFGKYKGKTFPQVAFADPDYIYWARENNTFKSPSLASELAEVARKGQRIKILDNDSVTNRVRYYIDRSVNKVANVDVIPADEGPHHGSSGTRESDYFDLSMPRQVAAYDKTGGRFVIAAIKYHIFGNSKVRMTRATCESFFDNNANFA